jgi:multidrug efflux pump subunit AcrA (membrane-fusion protein)
VKKGPKIILILAIVIVVGGGVVYALRGKIFPARAASTTAAAAAYTKVKVAKGNISLLVAASGKLEPNEMTTVRPDSNMPTRKLVRMLVVEGQRVAVGQGVAEVDPSGLDLDLASARANYESQKAKLENLKARPTKQELAQAAASLASAKLTLQQATDTFENAKALVEKDLAPKAQLADAERQRDLAQARYDSAVLDAENVKEGPTSDLIQAQESALAQADNALQKARLIMGSTTILSPAAGVIAEILVKVGDLVGPSTAIVTVVDNDTMVLQAQVNENDMGQLKVGQSADVTPSGFPDLTLTGTVTQIDLRAQVSGNVSSYYASIRVPNKGGKLLWGMSADCEIKVLELTNVLTLPAGAVKTSGTTSQVNILDGDKVVPWDVQVGASDGVRTQIAAGLDEGEEVLVAAKKAPASSTQARQGGGFPGGVFGGLH